MKKYILCLWNFLILNVFNVNAQNTANLKAFYNATANKIEGPKVGLSWPVNKTGYGRVVQAGNNYSYKVIAAGPGPAFMRPGSKHDFISQSGWNLFFDRVRLKPFQSCKVEIVNERAASVCSLGSRTIASSSDALSS